MIGRRTRCGVGPAFASISALLIEAGPQWRATRRSLTYAPRIDLATAADSLAMSERLRARVLHGAGQVHEVVHELDALCRDHGLR